MSIMSECVGKVYVCCLLIRNLRALGLAGSRVGALGFSVFSTCRA
jgi:hypothetical protein